MNVKIAVWQGFERERGGACRCSRPCTTRRPWCPSWTSRPSSAPLWSSRSLRLKFRHPKNNIIKVELAVLRILYELQIKIPPVFTKVYQVFPKVQFFRMVKIIFVTNLFKRPNPVKIIDLINCGFLKSKRNVINLKGDSVIGVGQISFDQIENQGSSLSHATLRLVLDCRCESNGILWQVKILQRNMFKEHIFIRRNHQLKV